MEAASNITVTSKETIMRAGILEKKLPLRELTRSLLRHRRQVMLPLPRIAGFQFRINRP